MTISAKPRGARARPVSTLAAGLAIAGLAAAWLTSAPVSAAGQTAAETAAPDRVLRLEAVVVEPADPATVRLVRQMLPLAEGAPVDLGALELARESLEASGYFASVDLYTARGTAPGRLVLYVDVETDRRVRFLSGFGYDPMDGWYLNLLGARLLNRPRPGSELRLAVRSGQASSGTYLAGRLPAGDRAGTAWLLDLHAGNQRWAVYERREEWEQTVEHQVARIGRQTPVGAIDLTGWFGYSWRDPGQRVGSWLDGEELDRPAADLLDVDLAGRSYLDLWLEARRDFRDPLRPWWRGCWWGVRVRASREMGGGSFYTLETDLRQAWPLTAGVALAGRLRAAHAGSETPYHQRFQFGGVGSVRGYDFGFLSGATGATELVQANLELRAALLGRDDALPAVAGLVFLDTGQSWDGTGGSRGWVAAVGWGVRVRLPWVQYLGVEVGYPLVATGGASPVAVNVALGWSY